MELVPRQFGPMIKVKMFLREIQGKSRNKKKKIMTDPDCENIRNDMFEVVTNMHDALNHIKRCEAVVFPNLKLKSQYLQRPDFSHNMRLLNITKLINELLKECIKGTKEQLRKFNQYVTIFEKRTEDIILVLKK